jgi:hypothetical protein
MSSRIKSLSSREFSTANRIAHCFTESLRFFLGKGRADYVNKCVVSRCFAVVVDRTLSYGKFSERIPWDHLVKGNLNAFMAPLPYSGRYIREAFRFLVNNGFIFCIEDDTFMINVPAVLRHMLSYWVKRDPDSVACQGFKTASALYDTVCTVWKENDYPVSDLHTCASKTEEPVRSAEEIQEEIYAKTAEGKARVTAKRQEKLKRTGLQTGADVKQFLQIKCEEAGIRLSTWTKGKNNGQAKDFIAKLQESARDPIKTLTDIVDNWDRIARNLTDKFGSPVSVSGKTINFDLLYCHRDRILELLDRYVGLQDKTNYIDMAEFKRRAQERII